MATRKQDNAKQTGPVLEATYRFILWLVPTVKKFPSSQDPYPLTL